jgi:SET domain-containing protein
MQIDMPRKSFRVGRAQTGLGLFATETIPKGEIIVEYRGRRIPTSEARRIESKRASKYMFEINGRWTLDGSSRRNLARYANHACRPNAESALVKGKMVLRAIKVIRSGDEITFDYGEEYFDLFLKAKGCKCATCHASGGNRRAAVRKPKTR